jgi:hypothetical protein
VLITFSGLDGAGKSTLIAWLRTELERRRHPVTVLHMTDQVGVYACLRAVRDGIGRLARRSNGGPASAPRPAGARGLLRRIRDLVVWNRPIRRALYPIDLVIFLSLRFYIETVRRRVLVMDRYFYDTLVDVADDRRWFWVRLLAHLTPTPDVPVFLDTSPALSYARKGEYSVAYLTRRARAYHAVRSLVPALVLPNDDRAATERALAQAVARQLGP